MKVTFDSNVYRHVTDPARFAGDPAHAAHRRIHRAIEKGEIEPFFCVTVATLEAVGRDARADYLAGERLRFEDEYRATNDGSGRIEGVITIGPDDAAHPGLPKPTEDWLRAALDLGFRFLAAPRIGQPRPAILQQAGTVNSEDGWGLFERFSEVVNAIEARGLGMAQLQAIAAQLNARYPLPIDTSIAHWAARLRDATDLHERRAIARAVAEWSDADAVAAHLAYRCDIFCTEDRGRSASAPSVLGPDARRWLATDYGLVIASANELAALL